VAERFKHFSANLHKELICIFYIELMFVTGTWLQQAKNTEAISKAA
jgi:hypothetical protein